MPEFVTMGLLVFIGLPVSIFIGVMVGKGIQQLLPSKPDTPVAICAVLALIAACIFIFSGTPATDVPDQDRWYRR